MKILVTGGAGFIGSHIVEHFHDEADVTVLDNLSTGSEDNLKSLRHTFIKGNVTDFETLDKAMNGCDYVFHLAAFISVPESVKHPGECSAVNVMGTDNVLKAAEKNGVKKVIFSSSCAVYGDSPVLPKKESMIPDPKSPYAESKLKAEELMSKYQKEGKIETCCLRFFNVFGPRQDPESQYAAAIPIFISKALDDGPITIFGDGEQTRDFIYVKDVIRVCVLALESLVGIYNVGTGMETSINDLAKGIIRISRSDSEIIYASARAGDIVRSYGDISKLKEEGFVIKYSLDEGLRRTVDWMRK